jgi:Tfp pilus assembly protein PilF
MPDAAPSLKSVLHYYESRLSADTETRLSALRSSLLADPRNKQSLFAMYELYLDRKDYRKAQYYLKQVIALDPANPAYLRLQTKLDEMLAR